MPVCHLPSQPEQQPPEAFPRTKACRRPRRLIRTYCELSIMLPLKRFARTTASIYCYVLSPNLPAFSFRVPFVVPIFDLNHQLQPEFPEVSAFGETNNREHFYINTCKFATLVLVDSEIGKADVLQFLWPSHQRGSYSHPAVLSADREQGRCRPNKTRACRVQIQFALALFFLPGAILAAQKSRTDSCRQSSSLPIRPATSCRSSFAAPIGLTSMAPNFKELMALAVQLGIADRVRYLGSVPDEDMAALYTLSAGLVMPTFFGPTNIPPLEAWHFGRPVITSDIRGCASRTAMPACSSTRVRRRRLAEAMRRVWRDDALCAELVARGRAASCDL